VDHHGAFRKSFQLGVRERQRVADAEDTSSATFGGEAH
jgi:hypothetical protein